MEKKLIRTTKKIFNRDKDYISEISGEKNKSNDEDSIEHVKTKKNIYHSRRKSAPSRLSQSRKRKLSNILEKESKKKRLQRVLIKRTAMRKMIRINEVVGKNV